MKNPIALALQEFLSSHCDHAQPLLIALSGGPDSMALFHALTEYVKEFPLKIGVAHVDHRWRDESEQEAKQIGAYVRQMGFPYHEKVLNPAALSGNLESACREERYRFFAELARAHGYQAVVTGHQSDDLAETVLKRLFEGSTLPFLSGIHPTIDLNGVAVWRPLLEVSKQHILSYVEQHQLPVVEDWTNRDCRFLRGRMRSEMIPMLCESFGKQALPGLCRLAKESQELQGYLSERIAAYLDAAIKGPFGYHLDLNAFQELHPLELKFLIRQLSEQFQVAISREAVDTVSHLLLSGKANKSLPFQNITFYLDRKQIFICNAPMLCPPSEKVKIGLDQEVAWGKWKVKSSLVATSQPSRCSWKELWKGEGTIVVPAARYELHPPDLSHFYPGSNPLSKWWTDHKVPAFLRRLAPVLVSDGKLACELLTGQRLERSSSEATTQWMQLMFTLYG